MKTEPKRPPLFTDTCFDLVVIAASAGGIRALVEVLSMLEPQFPAAIAIVLHLSPHRESLIDNILRKKTPLQVKIAENNDSLHPGSIYFAPPDHHLRISPGCRLTLSHTAQQHFVRPSAEVLFTSAAEVLGERVLGVVLTGFGKDGSEGVCKIHQAGGVVIAQDKATSEHFDMPQAAILTQCVDYILPLVEIPVMLKKLTEEGQA